MQDPRGGICTESEHVVQQIKTAKEWARREVQQCELPLKIIKQSAGNGRHSVRVYNCMGQLIARRG